MKNILKVILTVCAVLLIGCGTSTQTEEVVQQETQQETGEKSSSSGASATFADLIKNKDTLEWQVTYDVKTTVQGQETKSKMTQFVDGPNKLRTDITGNGFESRTYAVDGVFTLCTKVNNKWNCNQGSVMKDSSSEFSDSVESNPEDYRVEEDGTMKVITTQTTCYKVTDAKSSAVMRYCFAPEGVPLYISMALPEMTTEMTGLLYEKVVGATVFSIPS